MSDLRPRTHSLKTNQRRIAIVRAGRRWRLCFVDNPELYLHFSGVFLYGGSLKEAREDAQRLADDWDLDFVGRLDEFLGQA